MFAHGISIVSVSASDPSFDTASLLIGRLRSMVSDQAYLIVSTPLDDACDAWPEVPSAHRLIAGRGMIAIFLRDKSLA